MFGVLKKTKRNRRGYISSRGATQYMHDKMKKRQITHHPTTTPEPLRFAPPDQVRYNISSGLNLDKKDNNVHRRSGT